ncbi:hypothetical protein ACVWYG_001078 [Pedobacter sp. UYEF25]
MFFDKQDTMLGYILGSCFLLPIAFFVATYIIKLAGLLLVFLLEKFGNSMDVPNAELVVVYSLLPISILYGFILIPFKFGDEQFSQSIIITFAIYSSPASILFRAIYSLTDLSWNKSFYVVVIFTLLPYLLLGAFSLLLNNVMH